MSIELYTYDTPNGRKISVALEEFGLPYQVRIVDLGRGQQFEADFLAISPNNKIPAIRDPDGPGAQPITVFESGAILLYLAEKTGRFLPRDLAERVAVYEWLMWQVGGFGPAPGQVHHFLQLPESEARDYGVKRFSTETHRLYRVLDARLAAREYVATSGEPSIADFAILGWAWRHERHRVSFADLPHVAAWYERMMSRPAVQRGFAVKLA
ncbi:glutathione S-transferase N-terminal domain-containing protein [Pseudomonas sp. GD03842]|uniref:glutathione S-transferase family protein n=1 Tax=Pseudomonas sp. GD03842 TaxID=2975385 RepID=UPI00244BB55F|nr:glutathione binding-like protein [Pseudomonas sp. GD03842]MDH0747817.1 glutathione S-transferase N-terminal domain-containing protein [Pseudomonas sp. GD03842]